MPSNYESNYADLISHIMRNGDDRQTRNANTRAVFGKQLVVKELLWGQFPILSGRRMYYKGVFGELAAFLKGPKHIDDFTKEGCNYWKKWSNADGSINVDYGNSWIDFNGVNQLEAVLASLSEDPNGRRHIISGWRPDNLNNLSLPCCHLLYQWFVQGNNLDMIWYQRSVDVMVGLPSDVILAAAWNILMADQVGLQPGRLIFMLGDTHIYHSHMPFITDYLDGVIYLNHEAPTYFYEGTIYDFNKNSIKLINYDPMGPIGFRLHV